MSPSFSYLWIKRTSQNKRNTIVPQCCCCFMLVLVSVMLVELIRTLYVLYKCFRVEFHKYLYIQQELLGKWGKQNRWWWCTVNHLPGLQAEVTGMKDEGWVFMTCDLKTFIMVMCSYSVCCLQVHPTKSLQTSLNGSWLWMYTCLLCVSSVMNGDVCRPGEKKCFFSR